MHDIPSLDYAWCQVSLLLDYPVCWYVSQCSRVNTCWSCSFEPEMQCWVVVICKSSNVGYSNLQVFLFCLYCQTKRFVLFLAFVLILMVFLTSYVKINCNILVCGETECWFVAVDTCIAGSMF